MRRISILFKGVNDLYEQSRDTSGLKIAFRMIVETSLVELCRLGNAISGTQRIIFQFFIGITFLEKKWDQVQLYINILRNELKAICEDESRTDYVFDKDHFSRVVTEVIDLVAKIYFTQY